MATEKSDFCKLNPPGIAAKVINIDGSRMPIRGILKSSKPDLIAETMNEGVVDQCQVLGGCSTPTVVTYSGVVQPKVGKKINFRAIEAESMVEGIDVMLSTDSVREVNNRYTNTLFGYFLGKRLAFPVVEAYVKNAWGKFGIKRSMMNAAGFFFFQFESKEGMEKVMENGPWIIRSMPLILNIWSPSASLCKSDITRVPVWVKLHNIPLVAFTEDGLSMLATKLGNPVMLDSYTSDMCSDAWGRSSYARALIELKSECELKSEIVIGIPSLLGKGHTSETITVEYEWQPPRCALCKTFGHNDNGCPKQSKQPKPDLSVTNEEGFVDVKRKGKYKGKQVNVGQIEGVKLSKPKPNFVYRVKTHSERSRGSNQNADGAGTSSSTAEIKVHNSFDILAANEDLHGVCDQEDIGVESKDLDTHKGQEHELDDDIEVVYDETAMFMVSEGASTPGMDVSHV